MGSRPAASEYVWMWEARKPITSVCLPRRSLSLNLKREGLRQDHM